MESNGDTLQQTPRLAYRVSELPAALGIGRTLAYDLVKSGKIPSIKAGKAILVPVHALEAFLAGDRG